MALQLAKRHKRVIEYTFQMLGENIASIAVISFFAGVVIGGGIVWLLKR
ncbi:MAG: hypothetical protein ACR2OR_08825 [Hyphomicrobiales bacterium]